MSSMVLAEWQTAFVACRLRVHSSCALDWSKAARDMKRCLSCADDCPVAPIIVISRRMFLLPSGLDSTLAICFELRGYAGGEKSSRRFAKQDPLILMALGPGVPSPPM